jgi:DNA polymerase-4
VAIAELLRARIASDVGLSCSVGVATSKFIAKLASEAAKPRAGPSGVCPGRGVVEVTPGAELAFLHPLPVEALWGVGPATLARLARLGVATVGDLAQLDESTLVGVLGSAHGRHLHRLAHARDDRPVDPDRVHKSIGHEETFAHDRHERDELWREVVRMSDAVASRLREQGVAARTVTLKVRFATFATITRSITPATPVDTADAIVKAAGALLADIDPSPGVRLLGVSASNLCTPAVQLALFSADGGVDAAAWSGASAAIDSIRDRFGAAAIAPASTLDRGRVRVRERGQQQWGPDST